jgi:hypothetical protein
MTGLLYGTQPNGPATFAVLVLSGVAVAASYIPARREAKVIPSWRCDTSK